MGLNDLFGVSDVAHGNQGGLYLDIGMEWSMLFRSDLPMLRREGGREGGSEGGREGERKGGTEGGRKGGREEGREGGRRNGGREREGGKR